MSGERRFQKSRFRKLQTHIVVLVLAASIWWVIRQSDEVEETIENRAAISVRLELGDEADDWDLATNLSAQRFGLVLAGPREEVQRFAGRLANIEGGAMHEVTISEAMLRDADSNAQARQRTIHLTLETFKIRMPGDLHPEVSVRFAAPERKIDVVLERVEEEAAVIVNESSKPKAGYNARFTYKKECIVRGAHSKLANAPRTDGKITIALAPIDLSTIEDPNRSVNLRVRAQVPEGLTILDDKAKPQSEYQVDVSVSFERKGDYQERNVTKTLDILLARWMHEKRAQVLDLDYKDFPIFLEVDSDSAEYFTAANVLAVVDLSTLDEAKLMATATESVDGKTLSAAVPDLFVRVILASDVEINYRIPARLAHNTDSLENYFRLPTLTLTWNKE